MKKSLLSMLVIILGFNVQAQNLPVFENFDNGLPAGWTLVSAKIDKYERTVASNCVANTGIIAGPGIGSNGNNKTGFTTSELQYVNPNSVVTVRFEGYVYSGNRLRCADQLFASTPCSGVGRIYIVSASSGDTLGSSAEVPLNLTTGLNSLTAVMDAAVTPGTEFYVLLDISNVSCQVNGSIRFAIDNVFIDATAGGPLPVNFKSFGARRTSAQQVMLNWTTAAEYNNKGFYVYRNTNGSWESIAFIPSGAINGNSNVDLYYAFNDLNNFKGISQYRILQVDINGLQKMSNISFVKGLYDGKISVFPNPSTDGNTTVLFEDQNAARDINVFDQTGRLVKQWVNVNNNNITIDNLKPGFYSIMIINRSTGEQAVEKLIVNNR